MKCPKCGGTHISTDTVWDSHECVGPKGCHHRWSTKKECLCPTCGSKRTIWDVGKKPWSEGYGNRVMRCCVCNEVFWESEAIKKPQSTIDKTVEIPIDINDEEFLILSKIAHEQNITFNQLINNILREQMIKERESFEKYTSSLSSKFCETDTESTSMSRLLRYVIWLERKLYDNKVPIES